MRRYVQHPLITEFDLWAVLIAALLADEFPETPTSVGYGSLEPLGSSRLGTLHAAHRLVEAGVIQLDDRQTYRLTDHPLALMVKGLASDAHAQSARSEPVGDSKPAAPEGRLGFDRVAGRPAGLDLRPVLADGAHPIPSPVADQDDLLAHLETRLAGEMRDFVGALLKLSRGAEAVRKELPLTSHFGQYITLFLSTLSLQIAHALLKDGDLPLLLDDGAQHLQKMGLRLDELFRELVVDGRRFLAVALPNQQPTQFYQRGDAGADARDQ
ncbi:MAG: hypothetical protein ACK4KV_19110 [Rhodocyclaceae bacterium]